MTYNTNTNKTPCTSCGRGDIEGQWWSLSGYSTGDRLVSGYYCPKCAHKVFDERKKYDDERRCLEGEKH
jgi:hypothetical protein